MSENTEYTTQQIVWASVERFPAWPAKIVRKLSQHGKTVYKVNFFGDPSYCYVHAQALSPFNEFQTNNLQQPEENLKLRRAIQLAKVSFARRFYKVCHFSTDSSHTHTQPQQLPIVFEQTEIFLNENIELPQKNQVNQVACINVNTFNCMPFDTVTPQNVIKSLDQYEKMKSTSLLENFKRKQIICFQNQLRQKLLLKYKLNTFNFLKQSPQSSQPSQSQKASQYIAISPLQKNLVQKRSFKRQKNKNKAAKFEAKQLYLRKFQKILIRKGIKRISASGIVLKIVSQVQKGLENELSLKQSNLKQKLVKIMYQISCNMQSFQQIELDYLQKQVLSLIYMQFQNAKIEEGSAITQANEQFMV